MKWFAVLLGLVVCGCTDAKSPTVQPEPDYTTEMCRVEVTGPAATQLQAVQIALDRGCPRRALDLLAKLPSSMSAEEAAEARFLGFVARGDSLAAGLDTRARTLPIHGYERLPWLYPDGEIDTDLLINAKSMVEALKDAGADGAKYMESGRHAQLYVRTLLGRKCMKGVKLAMLEQLTARTAGMLEAFDRGVGIGGTRGNGAGRVEVEALFALFGCDAEKAAAQYSLASKRYEGAGLKDDALKMRLWQIEAEFFDYGRADQVGYVATVPQALPAVIADEVAAANGGGPLFERARRATTELDEFDKRLPPLDLKVHAEVLRATVAFALSRQSEDALQKAQEAMLLARRAKRADMFDRAQFIRLMALLELGRGEEAERVAKALKNSLVTRGRVGALDEVALWLSLAAQRLGFQQRAEDALTIARIVGDWKSELGLLRVVQNLGAVSAVLVQGGLFEDALLFVDDGLRLVDAALQKDPLAPDPNTAVLLRSVLEGVKEQLGAHRDVITATLGLTPTLSETEALLAQVPPELAPLATSIDSGDADALVDFARMPLEPDTRFGRDIALAGQGMCSLVGRDGLHAVADQAIRLAQDLGEAGTTLAQGSSAEATGAFISSGIQTAAMSVQFSVAIASCGAMLGDYELAQKGAKIQRTFGSAFINAEDPLIRELLVGYQAQAGGRLREASQQFEAVAQRSLQRTGLSQASGVGASQTASNWYNAAAVVALKMQPPDIERAVRLIEESRSRDLRARRAVAAVRRGALDETGAVERRLIKKRKKMRTLVSLRASQRGSGLDAINRAIGDVKREIDALEQQRDGVARRLSESNPAAYRAAALAPPPTLRQLQGALATDEVAVYYVTEGEASWAIVVAPAGSHAISLPSVDRRGAPIGMLTSGAFASHLNRRIKTGRGLELDRGAPASTFERSAETLYEVYGRPLEGLIPAGKRIIFVAGPTSLALPLPMLGGRESPWIARNPMRIAPTGGFVLDKTSLGASRAGSERRALVVGDPVFEGRGSGEQRGLAVMGLWKRLPGTVEEAKAIAKLYDSELLMGADATEKAVVAAAGDADVLHFATHGYGDPNRYANSALIFSKPSSDDEDDGILYAYEVERLRLRADLVVLSACETGKGQVRGSEGVLALDRAFLVAGARAVVSSLWVVDDDSTAALMRELHDRIGQGKPADAAMAGAMLKVRERWPDPYYWSGFRVIGVGLR